MKVVQLYAVVGIVSLAAFFPGAVLAQVAPAKGPWYAVVGLGKTYFESEFSQTASGIRSTGATAFTVDEYDPTTLWRAHIGYRLSARFAIEAGYWDFGTTQYVATITAPVATRLVRTLEIEGVSADLVYFHPIGERLSGIAKAGVLFSRTRASAAAPGGGLAPVASERILSSDGHLGVGLSYRLTRDIDARVEYDYFRKVGDDIDRLSTSHIQAFTVSLGFGF